MRLTPRQQQIIGLVGLAYSNKQIAEAMEISIGTVRIYLHQIFNRLKVHDRVELALWAHGLWPPEPGAVMGRCDQCILRICHTAPDLSHENAQFSGVRNTPILRTCA